MFPIKIEAKKTVVYEFDTAIYPCLIWVSAQQEKEGLSDIFIGEIEELGEGYHADVSIMNKKEGGRFGILIRAHSKKNLTTKVIAHEAYHAAQEIFHYVGSVANYEDQEPFAYLLGYIAECIEYVKHLK